MDTDELNLPITEQTPSDIDGDISVLRQGLVKALRAQDAIITGLRPIGIAQARTRPEHRRDVQHYDINSRYAEATRDRINALKAEYDRRPWTRYYLVPDGHVHTTFACRRDQQTPSVWLTDHSGATPEQVVSRFGAILCIDCFPDAPPEHADAFDRVARPARKNDRCPGSGSYDYLRTPLSAQDRKYRYGDCPVCGYTVRVKAVGRIRQHRSPDQADHLT